MEKVRIGNDMRVNFSVYRNGEPESFDGASNIVTKLVNEAYNKLITHTYTITGNIVQFDIDALQLTQCGKCRLFISYTKGGDYTVDSPAFELVNYTGQTGGTEIIGVEIVSINISGDIGINRDGLSAYEVWESYPGNEGKTIEQYFEWLRENPTKIDLDGLNSNIRQLKFNTDTPLAPTQAGRMAWSDEEKTGVLHNGYHSHPLGKETFFTAKNPSGTSIANGKAVYAIGSTGANATIGLATTANGDIAQRTIGIATMDIASNGFGDITTFGEVNGINTSGLTEGALVYLGLNGNLTSVEPVAPTPKISLGLCIRSHLTQGRIAVYVRPIARINKLTDVYAPNLLDGDVLRWNGTALRYEVYNLVNKADLVGGKVPASQLPAYVDDIIEYANLAAFPAVGETGKLYITLDTNLTYRWSGSAYTEVSKSLAIGITSTTAFRGDWGKIAYDHSQLTNSNPHGTTAAQITNTPAGTISSTTVQSAINELDADRVQLETDLNEAITALELEQIQGGVYDVSSHNDGAVFDSLPTLLGSANLSTLIPTSVRRGGMSIRFIQGSVPNSDNKYVQYRYMESDAATVDTFTNTAYWEIYESYDAPQATKDVRNIYGIREILTNFPIGESDTFTLTQYYNRDTGGTGYSQVFKIEANIGGSAVTFTYVVQGGSIKNTTEYIKITSGNKAIYLTVFWRNINSTPNVVLDRNFIRYKIDNDVSIIALDLASEKSKVDKIVSNDNSYSLLTEHRYYVLSNGANDANNGFNSSGLFPITEGMKITYRLFSSSVYAVILYYDENKNYVSGVASDTTSSGIYKETTVPTGQGIKYVRFSTLNTSLYASLNYVSFGTVPMALSFIDNIETSLQQEITNVEGSIDEAVEPLNEKYIDPVKGFNFGTSANDLVFKGCINKAWLMSYGRDLSQLPTPYLKYFGRTAQGSTDQKSILSFYYDDSDTEKAAFGNYYPSERKTGTTLEILFGKNVYDGLILVCEINWDAVSDYLTSGFTTTLALSEINEQELSKFDFDDIAENTPWTSNLDWRGKKIVYFGDSIAEFGSLSFRVDGTGVPKGYYRRTSDYISQFTGAKMYNVAIGGSQLRQRMTPSLTPSSSSEAYAGLDIINMVKAFCNIDFSGTYTYKDVAQNAAQYLVDNNAGDNNLSIIRELLNIDFANVDAVIMTGGGNDWKVENYWGTSGSTDIGTTLGAINEIVRLLFTAYPKLKVYWSTPIVSWDNYPVTQIIEDYSDNVVHGGKTKPEFVDMLVNEVEKYHLPVCNLYKTLGWNQYNFSNYFTGADGVHPGNGYKEIAMRILSFINSCRTF